MKAFKPAKWDLVEKVFHADCRIYQVHKYICVHPVDHRKGDFYVMECPDWAQVLALTPDRKIIMVQQFRFGSQQLSWEVPGGVLDVGEDPVFGAERELFEETGYRGTTPKVIGWNYPNPALQNNKTHYVLVENCEYVGGHSHDLDEEFAMKTISLDDAFRWIKAGMVTHTIAMSALCFLKIYLEEKEIL